MTQPIVKLDFSHQRFWWNCSELTLDRGAK